jgi:hypothetical protein
MGMALRGLGLSLAMEENLSKTREVTDGTESPNKPVKTMQVR